MIGAKYSYYVTLFLVLGLTASLTAVPSLIGTTGSQSVSAQPSSSAANNNSTKFLSFESQPPYTHRSAAEEWEPHQKQTNYTQEWWYLTAFLNDAKGDKYGLMFTDFKIDGQETPFAMLNPDLTSQLGPNQSLGMCFLSFTAYDSNHRIYNNNGLIYNHSQLWDSENNAKNYHCKDAMGSWGFDGTNMNMVVKSQNLSFSLDLKNNHPVMWTKDSVYNTQGVLQEGGPGNFSFYYSLPRLDVTGNLSYIDKEGQNRTMDVTGLGWVDRQWGDWNVRAWEWSSLRFDNGARVNLYSFGNALEGGEAYLVGTYQKADGSLQYFNNFTVKQDGYAKSATGAWISYGWSFDFPIDIEGSKQYSAVPLSNQFTNSPPVEWVYTSTNPPLYFVEQGGQLINNDTGETVGATFSESMPIQMLKNGPYDVNQH